MKKLFAVLLLSVITLALAACGSKDGAEDKDTITIGASNGLHAIILEEAAKILKEEGIKLDIQTYQDYVLPNQDLDSGELDANYFQHIPYLESEIESKGYDFVNAGGIHIEPIGIYSKKYSSLDKLPEGATIIISNSVSDQGRILTLLESKGLIKLKDGIDKSKATVDDIKENPKKLKIDNNTAPEMLVTFYKEGEGDAVVINSNFAIDAGINPIKDSIAIEGSESPYVNVIAVRSEDAKNENIKRLVEVLHSDKIQQFIVNEWGGAVVPVNE